MFKKGQIWSSPKGDEIFMVVAQAHDECGCIILRPVFLNLYGRSSFELGLPLDEFSKEFYTENKYKLVKTKVILQPTKKRGKKNK